MAGFPPAAGASGASGASEESESPSPAVPGVSGASGASAAPSGASGVSGASGPGALPPSGATESASPSVPPAQKKGSKVNPLKAWAKKNMM